MIRRKGERSLWASKMGAGIALSTAAMLALAACGRGGAHYTTAEDAGVKVDLTKLPGGAAAHPGQAKQAANTSIAYSYVYTLETPAGAIATLVRRHQAACASAGPAVCQLLDSQLTVGVGDSSATLNMRAEPGWLANFRNELEGDVRQAGGRVAQSDTSAEDLTRSIIDTQASVRAQTTLRDRLQTLLATRPGKLDELLNLEKELALTQGQLDATNSELAALNGRVEMSKLTINYATPTHGRLSAAAPLAVAMSNFSGTLGTSLAALITLVAALLPWAFLLAAVGLGVLVLRRRKR